MTSSPRYPKIRHLGHLDTRTKFNEDTMLSGLALWPLDTGSQRTCHMRYPQAASQIFWDSGSPSGLGQGVPVPAGDSLKMQILQLHLRLAVSESLGLGPEAWVLKSPPEVLSSLNSEDPPQGSIKTLQNSQNSQGQR